MAQPIDELQSDKTQRVLNLLSKLKGSGVIKKINIPEIVTIGDQDAGKSKVLSAICGITFPSEGGKTCTRMATRIDLRRGAAKAIFFKLVPNIANPAGLEKAHEVVKSYNSKNLKTLAKLLEIQAKIHAALGIVSTAKNTSGFSKHTLRIEIQGPDKPMLSLVDLPGIIQSAGPGQLPGDVKIIKDIAALYIRNPSAIILAIMSAGHDFQAQSARAIIDEHRATGRTMGVITKPDRVKDEEIAARMKAANDINFEYGWHVLMNAYDGPNVGERDRSEQQYFDENDIWAEYNEEMLGAPHLRRRLGKELSNRLTKDLPGIVTKLTKIATEATASLEDIGPAVEDLHSRRVYLVQVSAMFEKMASDAEAGRYDLLPTVNEDQSAKAALHLRAAVQEETAAFVHHMRLYGIKYNISGVWSANSVSYVADQQITTGHTAYAKEIPSFIGRPQAIAWVEKKHRLSRGQELPGRYSPGLVKNIFSTLATNWASLSTKHLDNLHNICREILEGLIRKAARPEIAERLVRHKLYPALRDKRTEWNADLARIQRIAMQTPNTKNPRFVIDLEHLQHNRTQNLGEHFITKQTPDTLAALGALGESVAYYETRLTFFLDAVTSIVVEDGLLQNLVNGILTPTIVTRMDEKAIDDLAGEDAITAAKRTKETKRKA